MIALAVLLLGAAPLDYAEAHRRFASGEADILVVQLTGPSCPYCDEQRAELDQLRTRWGVACCEIDAFGEDGSLTSQARSFGVRVARSIPQLIVYQRRGGRVLRWHRVGRLRLRQIEDMLGLDRSDTTRRRRPPLPQAASCSWEYTAGGVALRGESLRRHLVVAHGIDAEHLAGLTDADLGNLHSHAHEGTLPAEWIR